MDVGRKEPIEGHMNDSIRTTDISAITVNSASLEKIIGVSDRRVRQLAEEGILIRAAHGRYKLMESITNYILTIKVAMESGNMESADGELDLEEEKALHEKVKRHISELKLQTMRGELHKSGDVERVMTDMLVAMKTKLLAMPAKLAPVLVARHDIDFVRNAVSREVMEALNELKEYNPKDFYSDDYIIPGEEWAEDD